MTEEEYAARIAREREAGLAYVDDLLDAWCRACGWNPVTVWRWPRQREQHERKWGPVLAMHGIDS